MNLDEIVAQVSRDIDDEYDLKDIKDWVNRCLDDLTPIARRQSSAVLVDTLTLPDDLYELIYVSQNSQFINNIPMVDQDNEGFKLWGKSLILQNLDSTPVTIYYYRKLNHVEESNDIPDLEPEFHDMLVFFCLGNAQFYDEDYEYRPDSFNRYSTRKQEYREFIEKRDQKSRRNVVREKVVW